MPFTMRICCALILAISLLSAQSALRPGGKRAGYVIFITKDGGMEPPDLQCVPGPILLVIKNQTDDRLISLNMARTDGLTPSIVEQAANIPTKQHQFWLNLAEGTYELSETRHPRWRARLVVKR